MASPLLIKTPGFCNSPVLTKFACKSFGTVYCLSNVQYIAPDLANSPVLATICEACKVCFFLNKIKTVGGRWLNSRGTARYTSKICQNGCGVAAKGAPSSSVELRCN